MKDWKKNIYFILVEPQESGNIGASARALKNMGFDNLCLVRPPAQLSDEAAWFACNALDVLRSAAVFDSLNEALSDKSLVAGTTRRTGKRRGLFFPIEEGSRRIFETASQGNKVAVLFGRESRGLFNEEVEECGFLLTIPSSKEQPSLNISQAVLLTAYELSKTGFRPDPEVKPGVRFVDHESLTTLFGRITGALKLLEYIPRGNRDLEKKIMLNLKYFIGRAGITEWEARMLHGLCSQIERKTGEKNNAFSQNQNKKR